MVAVATRLTQGVGLVVGDIEQTDDALELCVEVAEAILRVFEGFSTYEHQRLMQELEAQGCGQRGVAGNGKDIVEKIVHAFGWSLYLFFGSFW